MKRPIGYFVHHQGRGHAERAAAIVNALPADRPVTLFCARPDMLPPLRPGAECIAIPSLFEAPAGPAPPPLPAPMPETLHCAPLGWPTITRACAALAAWFDTAQPALFVTDVSAELAQFARIAAVPTVVVVQHGERDDAGHMAAYQGASGLLAPYAPALEQAGRPQWMLDRMHHAPGVGVVGIDADRDAARAALGLPPGRRITLAVGGGGGDGLPATPLTLGARGDPDGLWISIGSVHHEWHATPPANLEHRGWVDRPQMFMAAADRIVSSAGNTTVHQLLSLGRPWVVVPEWRYFGEQVEKARALARAGVATVLDHWPGHAGAWDAAWTMADAIDPDAQRALFDPHAASGAAIWLDALAARLWGDADRLASISSPTALERAA